MKISVSVKISTDITKKRSQEILNLLNCKRKMRYAKQEFIAKYIQRAKTNDVCKKNMLRKYIDQK